MRAERVVTTAGSLRHQRGSVLVEAAILMPLLMLALMGVVEFGRMYYTKIGLENATREATRFAVTGNTMPDPGDPSQDLSRDAGIRAFLVWYLQTRFPSIDVGKVTITLNPGDGGTAGQILHVSTKYPFKFVTPMIGKFFTNDTYVIQYTSVMRNEPLFTTRHRT
jgi:Flp pilus assembly protein TadG